MKKYFSIKRSTMLLVFLIFGDFLLNSCTEENNSKIDSTPPGVPTDVKVEVKENSKTEVTVSWEAPSNLGKTNTGANATIKDYEIQYSTKDDFSVSKSVTSTSKSTDIKELEGNGTTYYFRVRAKNSANKYSKYSTSQTKTLGKASNATQPSAPTAVTEVEGTLSENGIKLSWTAPTDTGKKKDGETQAKIVSYKIEYSTKNDFSEDKKEKEKTDAIAEIIISGLDAKTTYYARVYAKNDSGDTSKEWSEASEKYDFTTTNLSPIAPTTDKTKDLSEKPEAPSNITNTPLEGGTANQSIAISWKAPTNLGKSPNGKNEGIKLIGYSHRLYRKGTEEDKKTVFSKLSNETSKNYKDLTSGKTYVFEIKTHTDNPSSFDDYKESKVMLYEFTLGNIKNIITITEAGVTGNMSTLILAEDGDTAPTLMLNYSLNDNPIETDARVIIEAKVGSIDLGRSTYTVGDDKLSGEIVYIAPTTFDRSKETIDVTVSITINNPDGEDDYPKTSRIVKLTRPMLTGITVPESTEIAPLTFNKNEAIIATAQITTTPENAIVEYTIEPKLPDGLEMDKATGIISGTPNAITEKKRYIVTATPTTESAYAGTPTTDIFIEVSDNLTGIEIPESSDKNPLVFTTNEEITPTKEITTKPEGVEVKYSFEGLPEGLQFNDDTGQIYGTPSLARSFVEPVKVIATPSGKDSKRGEPVEALIFLKIQRNIESITADSIQDVVYKGDDSVVVSFAVEPKDADATYSVSPELPTGLILNTDGTITGKPTVVAARQDYTVTVTGKGNYNGEKTTKISLESRAILIRYRASFNSEFEGNIPDAMVRNIRFHNSVNIEGNNNQYDYTDWKIVKTTKLSKSANISVGDLTSEAAIYDVSGYGGDIVFEYVGDIDFKGLSYIVANFNNRISINSVVFETAISGERKIHETAIYEGNNIRVELDNILDSLAGNK